MNTQCRSQEGSSLIPIIIIVALGLLVAAGGWWMLRGRDSSGSAFSVSEREWVEMHSDLKELRREVEALREAQIRYDGLYNQPIRKPLLAGAEDEPEKKKPAKATHMKDKVKVEDGFDRSGKGAFKAAFADAKRLNQIEDDSERLALAMELLDSENAYVRSEAILALLELDPAVGVAAIYGLLEIAADAPKGSWSATRAVEALGDLEGFSALSDLYRMYESDVPGVSLAAARALERQGDSTLIDRELNRLAQQLGANDPLDQLDAIQRMGETRSSRAVPHLIPLLSSPNWETRIRALDSLGRTGNESNIADIERMLNDPVAVVRDRAVRTIESLRGFYSWRKGK